MLTFTIKRFSLYLYHIIICNLFDNTSTHNTGQVWTVA